MVAAEVGPLSTEFPGARPVGSGRRIEECCRSLVWLVGKRVPEAACTAEVDGTTDHRWLEDNISSQAALNRGRSTVRNARWTRLLTQAKKATEYVERSITEGAGKNALVLLKGLGLFIGKAAKVGPLLAHPHHRHRQPETKLKAP
jgi:hypothetical protein